MSLNNFSTRSYQDHNKARLDHLATLGLNLSNQRVLEVGSGPGDHTGFYVERGNTVVSIDARAECTQELSRRFPQVTTHVIDMNHKMPDLGLFDIVHCYGLLYHLDCPQIAITSMAVACSGVLLLETCVSLGDGLHKYLILENAQDATQAWTGGGCRPTRSWVFHALRECFEFVYQTRTQPDHPEFPLDWENTSGGLTRMVFVASRKPLDAEIFK